MDAIETSLNALWRRAISEVISFGHRVKSRVGWSTERLSWSCELTDINQNFLLNNIRRADPCYAAAEFLWYMGGDDSVEMMTKYASSYAKFAEENGRAYGAYGPRIIPNLKTVIQLLRDHPETRQAVLVVWRPNDIYLAHKVNDIPCTVALQFLVRGEKLYCVTYMRSNDIWLGMPYDVFCFTMLQRLIADELNLQYGSYFHNVGSLHLYDTQLVDAQEAYRQPGDTHPVAHEWRNKMHLDELNTVVQLERKIRHGEPLALNLEMINDRFGGSATTDLLACCVAKLKSELVVDIDSPLLTAAMAIKYGERKVDNANSRRN